MYPIFSTNTEFKSTVGTTVIVIGVEKVGGGGAALGVITLESQEGTRD